MTESTGLPRPGSTRRERLHLQRSGLGARQTDRVLARVRECLARVEHHYRTSLGEPEVAFDLDGTSAGQYRHSRRLGEGNAHRLRFNPYILAAHFDQNLATTIPHEVAHFAVARLFPRRRLRPHGREWQEVMRVLGAQPEATHRFALDGLPVRRQQRWHYRCECTDHALSTTRHHRIQRGARYLCRSCRQPLTPVGPPEECSGD
jgi:SprT protein